MLHCSFQESKRVLKKALKRSQDVIGSSDQVQAELVDAVGVIAWLRDFLTRHPLTMRCRPEARSSVLVESRKYNSSTLLKKS